MKYPIESRSASVPSFGVTTRHIKLKGTLPKLQESMREARIAAEYSAASGDRLVRTRTGLGGTGDSHVHTALQLYNLRENAREAMRNHPLLGQLVRRYLDNVLGTGLVVDPETSSEAWNKKAQKLWEDWCADPAQCDLAKRRSFDQIERLALLGATVDGDSFAILDNSDPKRGLAVKLVEAEHVSGTREATKDAPGVILGVEIDTNTDEQLAFYFRAFQHVHESRRRGVYSSDHIADNARRIATRNADGEPQVIQIVQDDYRASANRGITFLAPVFSRVSAYDDTEWAQLVQQQIAACVAVFIQSEYPAGFGKATEETVDGFTAALEELTPGLIARLRPGEKIGSIEPKAPNSDARMMLMHIVREIGLQLDMPIELSMLDTSMSNFHGYRGALQQARKSFERRQRNFGRNFRGQVYLRKVAEWIKAGKLRTRKDWNAYRIQGPAWPYVDPQKDAEADRVRLATGATSPRRLQRERGQDWNKLASEIVEDNRLIIEAAAKAAADLNEKYPDALIHWRDLANRDAPAGTPQQQINQGPSGEESPPFASPDESASDEDEYE